MDKNSALSVISRFREAVEARGIRVSKLILFGSYAAGTQREGSDIDVIVMSDDFAGKGYWERIDILSDSICEVFEPIEAVAMTEAEWQKSDSAIVEYSKAGEVVYAATGT